jgi:hypothetical protein
VKFRPFQGRNEAATDRQCHEFGGREAKRRNVAEPLQEFPSHLTLDTFRHERPADRFNGRKVSAKGSRMACGSGIYRLGQLAECESMTRRFEFVEDDELADGLIVTRHSAPLAIVIL